MKTEPEIRAEIARMFPEIEKLKNLPGKLTPDGKIKNEEIIRLKSYVFAFRWVLKDVP